MARTSRVHRKELPQGTGNTKITVEKVYQVALYVRLSVLDGGKKDSDTAETQELLLRKFIEGKPYFSLFGVYIDNGESGVNFERDQFERMMGDVRTGRVDCIIVKDLSRFGRNYIEAGEYLEKVFPFLGVRFIAVNDGIDTANLGSFDSLTFHLKNLINDAYCRDISEKIRSVLRKKQERGEFIGAWAAYGYLRSQEDKNQLILDEKTAPIVRDIFQWRLSGLGYHGIARKLAAEEIPSPSKYRYEEGMVKDKRFANRVWQAKTIKLLLENEVYLGHTVRGKKRKSLYQREVKICPKEERYIVKNTHQAIIDQETFDKVQQLNCAKNREHMLKKRCAPASDGVENILKGFIYCGSCGAKLARYKNTKKNKCKTAEVRIWYTYICRNHTVDPSCCNFHNIREQRILQVVFEAIQSQVQLAGEIEKTVSDFQGRTDAERKQEQRKKQLEHEKLELEKVKRYQENLYDDYADGLMNEQDYIYLRARYKEKETVLQNYISELNQESQSLNEEKLQENLWLKSMLQFRDSMALTREMLATLISKIIVYDRSTLRVDFRFQDDFQKLQETLREGRTIK